MHDDDPTTTHTLDEVPTEPTAGGGSSSRLTGGRYRAGERLARIQGRLDHPAIVPVHELGRDLDGRPSFAMRKPSGTTLSDILAAGDARYPRPRLLRAFADGCLAVELAHTRGIVHRDLKPDNLMLGDFGETYVLGWGVARVLDEDDELATVAGTVIGSPAYRAPEQTRDPRAVDGRADVYSLGCVLFEILTGQRLHPEGMPPEGVDGRPSRRAPEREIPPELDALCVRAVAANRELRIATARELGTRVQEYLDGDRDVAQRRALGTAHLAGAISAFELGDRTTALREASRALALDPTLRDAAGLVTRIMIEPPPQIPAELAAVVERDNLMISRRTARFIAIANFGFLAFVPLLLVAGRSHPVMVGMMCVLVAANALLLAWAMRNPTVATRWLRLLINVSLTALVARIASPFLLGPGLAAVTAVGLVAGTFHSTRDAVITSAAVSAAVLVPWLAEVVGWLSPTMSVGAGHITIDSALLMDDVAIYAGLVLFTIVIPAVACVLTRGVRITEGAARMQLHLQAWQLRQLVP